ncbi:Flags: Precursor [Steccherinum ochraceum]|uniref:Flags n=1 Tax=Steccherinum ochraceum TaxID=92696 RepID=A0A4R0RFL5_9APHY|nr:Flags: Precursor [Steccherinum ochraceum]
MLRASGICTARRAGGVKNGAAARLPRYLGVPLQTRSLSLASVQSIPLRLNQQVPSGRARNFWSWSKPAAAQPVPTEPPTVSSPEPLVENAAPVEEVAAAGHTPVSVDSTSVPDVTAASDASGAVDAALSSIPDPSLLAPLQYGNFAALGVSGWSPAGLCAWGIELLQVSTGMPWFWTLIGAGVLSRVILFPLSVLSMKQSLALVPHQPAINKLREEMSTAQKSKDPLLMQKAILKQRVLYEKIGVSMPVMMAAPFLQLPVTLGMFFAVKRICDLPVEQLKWSGLSFLPDLTIADPTFVLPILATAAMNLQLSAGMRDMSAAPQMPHLINLFRVLSMVGMIFMVNLPSGVVVYITTGIVAMTAQTLLLRVPAIRRLLKIPILPRDVGNKPASMTESYAYLKKWWQDSLAEKDAEIKAARRNRR